MKTLSAILIFSLAMLACAKENNEAPVRPTPPRPPGPQKPTPARYEPNEGNDRQALNFEIPIAKVATEQAKVVFEFHTKNNDTFEMINLVMQSTCNGNPKPIFVSLAKADGSGTEIPIEKGKDQTVEANTLYHLKFFGLTFSCTKFGLALTGRIFRQ